MTTYSNTVRSIAGAGTSGQVLTSGGTASPVSWQNNVAANRFPVSPYIVGPVGQAPFQTIQAAITAASGAGGGTVWIQPGANYVENLTLADKVVLIGSTDGNDSYVTIQGTHTPVTGAGMEMGFENIRFLAAGSAISSAAAGSASFRFSNVSTSLSGYLLSLVNWVAGTVTINGLQSTGADGVINNTAGSSMILNIANCPHAGNGTGNPLIYTGGQSNIYASQFFCSVHLSDGSGLAAHNTFFLGFVSGGSLVWQASECSFWSAPGVIAFDHQSSGTVQLFNCSVNTIHVPAVNVAGSGPCQLTGIEFNQGASIAGTPTWGTSETGNTFIQGSQTSLATYVSLGMSPYTVTANDFAVVANSPSGAITINLPASPVSGRQVVIMDAGSAGSNNITLNGNGNDIVLGGVAAASQTLSSNFESISLLFETQTNNWVATAQTTAASALFPISPYVVGPLGLAGFQTIQSAITAASSAGGGTIYIMPATYAENLALAAGVHLVGAVAANAQFEAVVINGFHTVPLLGSTDSICCENILFENASGDIFVGSNAGAGVVSCSNCVFGDMLGYIYNLPTWVGTLALYSCLQAPGFAGVNGIFNIFNAIAIVQNCILGGGGSPNVNSNGSVSLYNSTLDVLWSFASGTLNAYDTNFLRGTASSAVFVGNFTRCTLTTYSMASSQTTTFTNCSFVSGSPPIVNGGGTGFVVLAQCSFNTDPTLSYPSIAYLPSRLGDTFVGGNLNFEANSSKINFASVSGPDTSTGATALSGGTVVVNTTAVTASSLIFLTHQNIAGTLGVLSVGTIVPGVSFEIDSTNVADTSTVGWWILN